MVPDHHPPDPQTLAEQMAPVALEYAERVRTDPPMLLWRELVAPYDGWHQAALIALLAAAVDPSVHPDVLWGWARHRDALSRPTRPGVAVGPEMDVYEPDEPTDVDALIRSMVRASRPRQVICDATGLSANAVKKRIDRIKRRDRAVAQAGQAEPAGAGVA